ncbi:MAG: Sua5/YciO/YrdC/YwlC family protein [Thermoleophilia bacterium]|nr:Sua5/YciO/YrdC/YwlC family protein [Thermoleophilia bacterium]
MLAGDADDPGVPDKVAAAKGRRHRGVALVCPPELFAEHVALDAPVLQTTYPFPRLQALSRVVHALGLILPAARPGAPRHVVQDGTILNMWTEETPVSPLRELVLALRDRGGRALAGTSANLTGQPTITDPATVAAVFADRVPVVLVDDFEHVPPERRRSASIVDLTAPTPRLVREGSVPGDELRTQLRRLDLGELAVAPDGRGYSPTRPPCLRAVRRRVEATAVPLSSRTRSRVRGSLDRRPVPPVTRYFCGAGQVAPGPTTGDAASAGVPAGGMGTLPSFAWLWAET